MTSFNRRQVLAGAAMLASVGRAFAQPREQVMELGAARAKASGLEVVTLMRRMPTDDDAFGPGWVREDGRKIHPACLFQEKKPEESRGPWDFYHLKATVPAEEAFRPLNEGGCPLVRGSSFGKAGLPSRFAQPHHGWW